jgi:hypothetical protein
MLGSSKKAAEHGLGSTEGDAWCRKADARWREL